MNLHLREVTAPDDPDAARAAYARHMMDMIRHMDALDAREIRQMAALLADARKSILDELLRLPIGEKSASRSDTLNQALTAIDRAVARFRTDWGKQLAGGLRDGFALGAEALPSALDGSKISVPWQPEVSTEQLRVALRMTSDLVTSVSQGFRDRTAASVRQAVSGGQSLKQLTDAIGQDLRTQPLRDAPRFGSVGSQAERIARTELMGVFNLANIARQDELGRHVPGMSKWWLSSRDGRVREAHATADRRYRPGG